MHTNIDKLEHDTLKNGSARQEFILDNDRAHQQVYDTVATAIDQPTTTSQSGSNSIPATHNQQGICYAHQGEHRENQRINGKLQQCVKQAIEQKQIPEALTVQLNFAFLKALIEWIFMQMRNDEWRNFAKACNYIDFWNRPTSIITFVTEIFGISLVQSMLVLSKYFGIYPENIFNVFPQSANAEIAIHQRSIYKKPVIEFIPQQLSIDGMQYNLTHRDDQYDYIGELEQVICTYTNHDGASLNVIASVHTDDGKSILTIGHIPAKAKLFSSTDIDRTDNPTVIICAELNTALNLRKFARETKLYDNCGIIISGYFGGKDAIQILNYSVLFGANVVIIPTPTRDGLNEAEDLLAKCATAGATSVKIFLGVVTFANVMLPENLQSLSSWLQDFLSKTIAITYETSLSLIATHIYETAVGKDAYHQWRIEHALSMPEPHASTDTTLRISSLDSIPAVVRDTSLPITTDDFFTHVYINLIWGPSNIGKTWIIIEICICIILGLPIFFLAKPTGVRKQHVVTVLDGENEDGTLKQRVTQLLGSKGYGEDDLSGRFLITGLEPGKSLLDASEQAKLLKSLRDTDTTLLVIDNILSLMPDATSGKFKLLFKLLAIIKAMGIIVIAVHHAGKDGETYLGSSTLESLSQNIIKLSRLNDKDIEAHQAGDDGAFYLKMQVTKCKVPGNTFANKSAIYTLPSGGGWQRLEGNLPYYDAEPSDAVYDISSSDAQSTETAEPVQCQVDPLPLMHPNDMKLFQFMKSKGSFTKKDIQNHLGVSEATSRNKINNFIDLDLIVKHGGKGNTNTYYTVK